MKDLISRQAVIEAIDKYFDDLPIQVYYEMVKMFENLPKDGCEYWDGESGFCALHGPEDMATLLAFAYESGKRSAEQKHGKWITKKDACGIDYQICSNCETEIQWRNRHGVILRVDMQIVPYCPYCGAKMERSEE